MKSPIASRMADSLPLDACRDLAAEQLAGILGGGLDRLRPELLRVLDMGLGPEVYYQYMGALELVRDHQSAIIALFAKAFRRHFSQSSRASPKAAGAVVEAWRLSLLSADALEESLAVDLLANAIRDNSAEELFGLDKRVGVLLDDADLIRHENPLGPDVIARATMDALAGFNASFKSRLLVMTQLSRLLPDDVRALFGQLNQLLVSRNVMPTLRIGVHRRAHPPMPAVGAVAAAGDGDLYALFQHYVGRQGGMAGGPAGSPESARSPVAAPQPAAAILHSLSQLQRGRDEGLAWSGLAPDALGDGRVNVLHDLRGGGMARANALDAMTLDIVAMVFDYILGDSRIPDAMLALIGRLQIPVLKVAMLDKSFFARKNHPVRRFLDALALAGVSLDKASVHASPLYRKAEELVARIVEEFDDRVEIFAEALAELNDFLAALKRRADAVVASGAAAIQAMESAELSRLAARDVVQDSLAGQLVPLAIRDFLARYWQRVLADIHQASGPDGSGWRIAVSTMTNLVWSVQPKLDPVERSALVGLIPSLLMELNMGADKVDMASDDRELFFATLAPCHTLALKAIVLEDEAFPQSVRVEAALPPMTESQEFEPVPVRPLPRAPASPVSAKSSIEGLDVGRWIQYTDEAGKTVVTRLSWISPLKGIYLFADAQGQSVLSITTCGLHVKLANGAVRLIDDAPLMDRVVDSMVGRLQPGSE